MHHFLLGPLFTDGLMGRGTLFYPLFVSGRPSSARGLLGLRLWPYVVDYKGLADNLGTFLGWATEPWLLAQAVSFPARAVSFPVDLLGTFLTVSAQGDPPTGPVSLQVFLWPNLALGRAVSEVEQIQPKTA